MKILIDDVMVLTPTVLLHYYMSCWYCVLQVLLTSSLPFKLGPRAFSFLLHHFYHSTFSVTSFTKALHVRSHTLSIHINIDTQNLKVFWSYPNSLFESLLCPGYEATSEFFSLTWTQDYVYSWCCFLHM